MRQLTMRQLWLRRVGMYLVPCVLTALLNAPAANAQNQVPIWVQMQGHANPVRIGTLTWAVRNPTGTDEFMEAEFTFVGGWGPILDPIYDFRWFQIINEDTAPNRPRWFNPDTGRWEQPNLPYVDPPSGGWDYSPADESPYYEDDAGFGGPFDFGDWHTENVDSRFHDNPRTRAGEHVLFKTFLVVVRHNCNTIAPGRRKFVKLAGFSWRLDGADDITDLGQIDPAREKEKIMQALGNSGFRGWGTIQLNDFVFVPEPASLLALAVGLAGLAYRRRRRAA